MVSRMDLDLLMTSCLMLSTDVQYVAVCHRGFRNRRLSIFLYYIFLIQIFMAQYLLMRDLTLFIIRLFLFWNNHQITTESVHLMTSFQRGSIDHLELHWCCIDFYMVYMPRHGQHHLQFRNKYISRERNYHNEINKKKKSF